MSPTLFFCCFSSSKNRNLQKKLPWMKVWEEKKMSHSNAVILFFLYRFFDRFNKLSRYFFFSCTLINSTLLNFFLYPHIVHNEWLKSKQWNLEFGLSSENLQTNNFLLNEWRKKRDGQWTIFSEGIVIGVAWFWLHTRKKNREKTTNACLSTEETPGWVKKMWADFDFLYIFFLRADFFSCRMGYTTAHQKKTSILKEIYFIL